MERWRLVYQPRAAMLGEIPATKTEWETEAETEGLTEEVIVDRLHHLVNEHTEGAGVLTEAERI